MLIVKREMASELRGLLAAEKQLFITVFYLAYGDGCSVLPMLGKINTIVGCRYVSKNVDFIRFLGKGTKLN